MDSSWFPCTACLLVSPVAKILTALPFTMSLGFEDLYLQPPPCIASIPLPAPFLSERAVEHIGEIFRMNKATALQLLQWSTPTFQPPTIWPGKCNCFI